MSGLSPIKNLFKRIHRDERGAVTLETILIVGAVAIPILIFIINYVVPEIKDRFDSNMDDLDVDGQDLANQNGGNGSLP